MPNMPALLSGPQPRAEHEYRPPCPVEPSRKYFAEAVAETDSARSPRQRALHGQLLAALRCLTFCVVGAAVCLCSQALADDSKTEIVVENAILKTIESTTMASQVAGLIDSFEAKEGLLVEAGQNLGKVRDEAVHLELTRLKLAIEVAQKKSANDIDQRLATKSMAVADNEYQRALNANRQVPDTYPINEIDRLKLLSDRAKLEVERAVHAHEMAALEVRQAENEYRKSYEVFCRHRLISPVSGVIVGVEKRVGEWVEPGTSLLRIVRLDRLRIEGFITAEASAQDLHGRTARITADIAGKPHETTGTVVFVSPDVNSVSSQVRVYLEIDNSKHILRPGLRVQASILPMP